MKSRARCVPLQTLLTAARGVKTAPTNESSLNQNEIVVSTLLQEREPWTHLPSSSLISQLRSQPSPDASKMFFEPSSKKEMNCEKYQDCSWFQEKPNTTDSISKLSPAELALPNFESDIDFDMQFANKDNPQWGDEYLGIFDDDDDIKKWDDNKIMGENKKMYLNNPSNNDIYYSYNNYKAGDDSVNDTYNINNFIIKKTDSFDNMKNISTTNPAEVVPISYREKLNNSQYGLSLFDEVKSEVKEEEAELYSPGSNTYMLDSDDSDLMIGREEIIEVDDRHENMEDISKKLPNNIWSDEKENVMMEPRKMERAAPVIQEAAIQKQNVMPLVASKNLVPTVSKTGLSLDLTKTTFDQPALNTPDLYFMDLVNYITNDTPTEPQIEPCLPLPSAAEVPVSVSVPVPIPVSATVPTSKPEKQKDVRNTYLAIPRQVTSNSREDKLPKMVILKTPAIEKSIDELSTINFEDIADTSVSIAERIKTSAKRRRSTKYSISELTGSDEEDRDDGDEDYDAHEEETSWRRHTLPRKRSRSSTISSESSCTSSKRIKEEPGFGKDKYRELRDKNNEASRRSRQNRKDKERGMFTALEETERKNVRLKARAEELEKLVTSLRQLLLQVVLKKGSAA